EGAASARLRRARARLPRSALPDGRGAPPRDHAGQQRRLPPHRATPRRGGGDLGARRVREAAPPRADRPAPRERSPAAPLRPALRGLPRPALILPGPGRAELAAALRAAPPPANAPARPRRPWWNEAHGQTQLRLQRRRRPSAAGPDGRTVRAAG